MAEPAIDVIEYIAYRHLFHCFGREKAANNMILLYTLLARTFALGVGFLLSLFLPGIFVGRGIEKLINIEYYRYGPSAQSEHIDGRNTYGESYYIRNI